MLFFLCIYYFLSSFFFNPPALFEFYTLSLHDALPISTQRLLCLECLVHPEVFYLRTRSKLCGGCFCRQWLPRSEEHTSELQSRGHLVCRLLLEKKKKIKKKSHSNTPISKSNHP